MGSSFIQSSRSCCISGVVIFAGSISNLSYSFSMHLHIAADVFMFNILITEHAISLIFYVEIYARRKIYES